MFKVKLLALLLICISIELSTYTFGQFWKSSIGEYEIWERETIASRPSGLCYKFENVKTLDPDLRQRQISYCCDGYINRGSSQALKCQPICIDECENGVCVSPGYCQCGPGYYRKDSKCC